MDHAGSKDPTVLQATEDPREPRVLMGRLGPPVPLETLEVLGREVSLVLQVLQGPPDPRGSRECLETLDLRGQQETQDPLDLVDQQDQSDPRGLSVPRDPRGL